CFIAEASPATCVTREQPAHQIPANCGSRTCAVKEVPLEIPREFDPGWVRVQQSGRTETRPRKRSESRKQPSTFARRADARFLRSDDRGTFHRAPRMARQEASAEDSSPMRARSKHASSFPRTTRAGKTWPHS